MMKKVYYRSIKRKRVETCLQGTRAKDYEIQDIFIMEIDMLEELKQQIPPDHIVARY